MNDEYMNENDCMKDSWELKAFNSLRIHNNMALFPGIYAFTFTPILCKTFYRILSFKLSLKSVLGLIILKLYL